MIRQDDLRVGDHVRYEPGYGKSEIGRVKEIPEHTKDAVRVVYSCDDKWDEYTNYTSQLTYIRDLKLGWDK